MSKIFVVLMLWKVGIWCNHRTILMSKNINITKKPLVVLMSPSAYECRTEKTINDRKEYIYIIYLYIYKIHHWPHWGGGIFVNEIRQIVNYWIGSVVESQGFEWLTDHGIHGVHLPIQKIKSNSNFTMLLAGDSIGKEVFVKFSS